MNVDYNVLKSNIIKACQQDERGHVRFLVNFDKLSKSVNDIGLTMINVGTKSERVRPNEVSMLSEYFKGVRLSWITDKMNFTNLVFVITDDIDDKCKELITQINGNYEDNPATKTDDIDKVNALSTIIAEYPCFFACVISYESNDPKRIGRASYEIKCRANTVRIKQENYKYNQDDMV